MSDLTLKELSLQLAMLLCLVSVGQRMQTIPLEPYLWMQTIPFDNFGRY